MDDAVMEAPGSRRVQLASCPAVRGVRRKPRRCSSLSSSCLATNACVALSACAPAPAPPPALSSSGPSLGPLYNGNARTHPGRSSYFFITTPTTLNEEGKAPLAIQGHGG